VIPFDEALAVILNDIGPLGTETIALADADGRVLRQRIAAPRPIPPHDNAALDGYAFRAADVVNTRPDAPARLEIIDEVAAGGSADATVGPNQAARIMTGAPIPEGADAVIGVEDTSPVENSDDGAETGTESGEGSKQFARAGVDILTSVSQGANIRRAGEDLAEGEAPFALGTRITPSVLGVIASMGIADLVVSRRPLVAVLGTGDEIIEVGEPYRPDAIYSSNAFTLRAMVQRAGADLRYLGIVGDDLDETTRRLDEAFDADLVLTTGGVSMGVYDHVRAACTRLGVRERFWKIAVKPGKPLFFGVLEARGDTPIFGLPGNPSASFVVFEELVAPALLAMQGAPPEPRPALNARMTTGIGKKPGRINFLKGRIHIEAGVLHVTPLDRQGSGVLSTMARANCFIVLDADCTHVDVGDTVTVHPFNWREL
jgi:molybdopterin molybdotransferase